jgi:hypothetical protein
VGLKQPGHETDRSSSCNAEVKNDGAIPLLICFHDVHSKLSTGTTLPFYIYLLHVCIKTVGAVLLFSGANMQKRKKKYIKLSRVVLHGKEDFGLNLG